MEDPQFYIWWLDLAQLITVRKCVTAGMFDVPNTLYEPLMEYSDESMAFGEGKELLGKVSLESLPEYIREAISPVIDDEWVTPDPRFSNCYGFFVALSQRVDHYHIFREHGKLQRFAMPSKDTSMYNKTLRLWWLTPHEIFALNKAILAKALSMSWSLNRAMRLYAERDNLESYFGEIDLADAYDKDREPIVNTEFSDEYRHQDRIGFVVSDSSYEVTPWVFEGCGMLELVPPKRVDAPQPLVPYTEDECRELFLQSCRSHIRYWQEQQRNGTVTTEDAISGVVHSVLATIGGCSSDSPGFMLVPCPHPDDYDYYIAQGQRPWPVPEASASSLVDIGEQIQSFLYQESKKIEHGAQRITLKEWRDAHLAERWRYVTDMQIKTGAVTNADLFFEAYSFAFEKAIELGMCVVPYEEVCRANMVDTRLYLAFDEEESFMTLMKAFDNYVRGKAAEVSDEQDTGR